MILLFIIYNFRNIENFSNPILSPNITKIDRYKNTIDLTFEKDVNDNIQPGDNYYYELYYKKKMKYKKVK